MSFVLPTPKEDSGGTYAFSSRPRPARNRTKYRAQPAESNERPTNYGNIMYDRRVVRGNTCAQQRLQRNIPAPVDHAEIRKQEAHKRALARKRAIELQRTRTPDAIEGRAHVDVQTELYLEELSNRIEETDVGCQTDEFLDKPPTPLFVPAKTGRDVSTEIKDGELFDFEVEVQPVLEVLVGKVMEQALLEVMEEEELACLRAQQRSFQELRDAELVEVQRLEEQERRRREEKECRIAQQHEVLEKERETAEKVAARAFTQQYLSAVVASAFTRLEDQGYFYDPVERDIETDLFPWLMDEVSHNLEKSQAARDIIDTLILEVTEKRLDGFQKLDS